MDMEDDVDGNESGCYQCKNSYGNGFWFGGLAYNSSIDGSKPIEYSGRIKTYSFFRCDCDLQKNVDLDYSCIGEKIIDKDYSNGEEYYFYHDNLPFFEIMCSEKDDEKNVSLAGDCVLFNIKYSKFENTNLSFLNK
jgi:hypothetical protein